MRIGLFTGSFDPITNGHVEMITRASKLFDQLYVGIFYNDQKQGFWPIERRERVVTSALADLENVSVITSSNELAVEVAKRLQVTHLVRGLRNGQDLEYEMNLEFYNHRLVEQIDTVYLAAQPAEREISSSRVRELVHFGASITDYVPEAVIKELACEDF